MAQTAQDVRTIGFIGAGHIGSTLARLFAATGRDVVLSNSRGPQTLQDLVTELGPRARAATAAEAGAAGDLVVVTVPLKAYASVPVEPLAGKIVVDTNNYYPDRDGRFDALDDESTTVSELLQAHLPGSRVVKAFNNIYYADLAARGVPAGTAGRRALPIAGDDAAARQVVSALIEELSFDVVDAGPLAEGWRFQRDTPAYVVDADTADLTARLARAKRYRDTTPEEAKQVAQELRAAFAG
jgi:predicted dinucleotide-binding enzyme